MFCVWSGSYDVRQLRFVVCLMKTDSKALDKPGEEKKEFQLRFAFTNYQEQVYKYI